jgi:hypothetical protein
MFSDPHTIAKIHGIMAGVWLVLALATTVAAIWFPDSPLLLAWVIFMSGYANFSSHLAARAGAGPSEEASNG